MAYEPVVESVDAKAQDLLLRSPASKATADTSTIVGRYQTLKEAAMVSGYITVSPDYAGLLRFCLRFAIFVCYRRI